MARLLTWNVAGRVAKRAAQAEAVAGLEADVVTLQEITPTTRDAWTADLEALGLHVASSEPEPGSGGSRRLGVIIAARDGVEALPPRPDLPWPERHLAVRTRIDGEEVEVHTLHSPLSQKAEQVKVRTLEALHAALVAPADVPRLLTGDLNTPSYESREGEIQTFARTRAGNIRPGYGERHDRAELLLLSDLPDRGWKDAFRALHGYDRRDRSYMIKPPGYGWRLDHILLSPGVEPRACEYVHEWRETGLSDHSGMWAEVAPS
jgi:exonuclease III